LCAAVLVRVPAVVLYCTVVCSCPGTSTCCCIVQYCCVQLSWYEYLLLYCTVLLCAAVLVRVPAVGRAVAGAGHPLSSPPHSLLHD
jgi:hypothetical protein